MEQTNHSVLKTYLLFLAIILTWGLSWPLMKVAVGNMPSLWLSAARLIVGTLCVFIFLIVSKQFALPTKADLPIISSIGILQMGIYLALINSGLQYVSAGRSAILCYTTPLWVTPLAVWLFKEPLSKMKLLGLILGVSGVALLFNPLSFNWHEPNNLIGNSMLLAAAICWSAAMLHTRYGKWHSPLKVIVAWQLMIGTSVTVLLALVFQPAPIIKWESSTYVAIVFTGVLSTAFGYIAAITVARRLPVITTSLCFLGVPVIGLLSSAILLHEPLTLSLLASMLLIISGLVCVSLADYYNRKKSIAN